MTGDSARSAVSLRRIEVLTLGIGAVAAVLAAFRWSGRTAAAVGAGAALSWVNFRWLRLGVSALANAAGHPSGEENDRIPKAVYVKFFGRYALLILAAYVILRGFGLPVVALVGGLLAAAAGVLAEMIWQLVRAAGDS